MKKPVFGVVAMAVLGAVVLAGCGTSSSSSTTGSDATSAASQGTLAIAMNYDLKPWGFVNDGEKEGINVDYGTALAEEMGLTPEFANVSLEAMIPGLEADRYDISLAAAFDNSEREEHVDFVDYAKGSSGVLVGSGEAGEYQTITDLCDASVGVGRGSVDQIVLSEEECPEGSIEVKLFSDLNSAALAVRSGQIDALAADSTLVGVLAKEDPDNFEATPITYAGGLIGVMLPKGSPMVKEVQEATQSLMDTGKLDEIFTEWGSPDAALKQAKVNAEG